jgi:hypothetical protein
VANCGARYAVDPHHPRLHLLGRRLPALHLRALEARPERADLDGEQIPDRDAWALFGTDHLISFMLHHFWLLYSGVILFSAAELIVGAMLMAGALTRAAALVSMGFSVLLMAMFG